MADETGKVRTDAAADAATRYAAVMEGVLSVEQQALIVAETKRDLAKQNLELIADAAAHGAKQIEQREAEIAQLQKKMGLLDESNAKAKDDYEDQIKALEEQNSETQRLIANEKELSAEARALHDSFGAQTDAIEEGSRALKDQHNALSRSLEAMTGIGNSWQRTALGATLTTAKTEGWAAAMSQVGKSIASTFSPLNIAGSLLAGVVNETRKMIFSLDTAATSFAKATGQGSAFESTIKETYNETRHLGVSLDDSQQALQGLMGSMAGFGRLGEDAQKSYQNLAAVLGEIGVDAATTGALMTNTTKTMGMNARESKKVAVELHGLSKHLDVSTASIVNDFNSVMEDLAIYGKDAPQVFKRLAGAAAETGVSIDKLVGSMKELDTITGAATRAGKLNAVLGGQFLGTHELLNASYDERLKLQRAAFAQSGKDWASMNRAEKQLIAQASGFNSVADAAKIYGNTTSGALNKAMDDAGNATGSVEGMNDAAKDAQSIQEKWAAALTRLAVHADTLRDALGGVITWIDEFLSSDFNKWLLIIGASLYFVGGGAMMAALGGLKSFGLAIASGAASVLGLIFRIGAWITSLFSARAAQALSTAATWFSTKAKLANAAATTQAAAANTAATSSGHGFVKFIKKLGKAATKGALGLLALGLAFLMIGYGIAIAAEGMSLFVAAFAGMSPAQILAVALALAVFAAMIVGIIWILASQAPVMAAAALGLLAFGLAAMSVGVAVMLMAIAFGWFVDAIIKLIPYADQLLMVGFALATIAIAGMLLLPGGFAAMIGLGMLALGLGGLALALWAISTDDLIALGMIMMGLGGVAQAAGDGLGKAVPTVEALMNLLLKADGAIINMYSLAAAIYEVADALYWMSIPRALQFTAMLSQVATTGERASVVTPKMVENISGLTLAAQEYSEIRWDNLRGGWFSDEDKDPFTKMLDKVIKLAGSGGGGGGKRGGGAAATGGPSTVILELDGKELGRTVEALLSKRNRLKKK